MNFLYWFFNAKYYGVARKILDNVEKNIAEIVEKIPRVQKIASRSDVDIFSIRLKNKSDLIETLRKILDDAIPYDRYQALPASTRHEHELNIASRYFNLIKSYTNNFEQLPIDKEEYFGRVDSDVYVYVSLPDFMFNETELCCHMGHEIAALNDGIGSSAASFVGV